jgi:methylmalonyl-CoA/ethylmalonyl-CoA epimerase
MMEISFLEPSMSFVLQLVHETPPVDHPFDVQPHHCCLSVPDLEASIAWYRDMLGFGVEMRQEISHVPLKGAFLKRGDCRIELFEVAGARPLPPERLDVDEDLRTHGTKHMALCVPNVREALTFLRARGVAVAMEPMDVEGTVACYIRDNSGILIELKTVPGLEQPTIHNLRELSELFMMATMKDKTALVTGGSGIDAPALAFADAGANVVVSDVNREAAEQTVQLITATGGRRQYARGCSRAEQVAQLIERTVSFCRPIMHNNAGISALAFTADSTKRIDRGLAVNLKGVWYACVEIDKCCKGRRSSTHRLWVD